MESLAENLATMIRRPLTEGHVALLRRKGQEVAIDEGTMLIRAGERSDEFFFVLEGEFELYDPAKAQRIGLASLGPGQFIAEISFLTGGAAFYHVRACKAGRLIRVPRQAVLDLMAATPEMSDIIVSVLASRRRAALENGNSGLTVLGRSDDRKVREIAAFAGRNRIPIRLVEPGTDEARTIASACGVSDGPGARVVLGEGEVMEAPTPGAIARRLGLAFEAGAAQLYDLVIVGGGPAGVAAAVYAGAEGLCALVVEDMAIGGQAGTSSRIENYMGFPTGISGADLCWRGEVQAMKFGTRFAMPHRVTALDPEGGTWRLTLDDGQAVRARAVVVATGVQYRRLPLPGLEEIRGGGHLLCRDRRRGALLPRHRGGGDRWREFRRSGRDVPVPHGEACASSGARRIAGRQHVELSHRAVDAGSRDLDPL